jgi:hypothetical protein
MAILPKCGRLFENELFEAVYTKANLVEKIYLQPE